MSATEIEVTDDTFEMEVIERSQREPVVVDFWAEWCGPCKTLGPVLEAKTAEKGVVLAKLDVDANQRIAQEYNVSGIPAVKAFRNGVVVAEFTKPPLADSLEDPEIAGPLQAGDYETALQLLLARAEQAEGVEEREAARKLMVELFQELGQEHPLASTYRKKLAAAIF